MNSAIQCLRHAMDLSNFFILNEYMHDINRINPLGMKGKIVETFAQLVTTMWEGNKPYVSPHEFKIQIGMYDGCACSRTI